MVSNNKNNSIIEFKNVSFGYTKERTILNNLSFSINENDYVCIVGKNGSGKSTLGHLLIGLLKPRSGEILYLGNVLTKQNINEYRHHVSAVLENPDSQFVTETVEDEIAFSLENMNTKREDIKKAIDEISASLNIKDLLDKNPDSLSGGQKQKVAIACCLVTKPRIIILDEATAMLDPADKLELRNLIKSLNKDYGITVISITHDVEEVMDASSIILIDNGSIIKHTDPISLFKTINVLKYGLSEPFAISLSKGLGIEITNDLDLIAKEVLNNEK